MKKSAFYLLLAILAAIMTVPALAQDETSFSLSEDYYTMHPNSEFVLYGSEGVDIAQWTSSNESVATVSQSGVVSSITDGVSVITATTVGGQSDRCVILVRTTQADSITLSSTNLLIDIRRTAKLTYTIKPADSSFKSVTWTSSKPSVATVDADGTIRPVSKGSTIVTGQITGMESKAKYRATCKVTVKNLAVRSVSVTPKTATLYVGNTLSLTAQLKPLYSDEGEQPFTWISLNESVATVDAETGVVTAVSPGTVKIRATNPGSGKSNAATITVKTGVESVSFTNGDEITYMASGETLDLSDRLVILPASVSDATVTWKSGNTAVATVDEYGVVTAVKTGTTTIKATAGGKTGSL
ncbi:MAG: Ig-like domain-containing protein, partial [Clostridia bacterium]|nr:Ig-like domain-containing protein [Clostridia bacterium]